jgi:RNA polymerase sigma-70 factor (ECF subfamily)
VHDDELVSAALGGDGDAFGALVERHRRDALRVAYGIADGEADDVAQDAFVKAFRNLRQFRAGASFRAWLLAIVANEARNRRRSFLRRNALGTVKSRLSRAMSRLRAELGEVDA